MLHAGGESNRLTVIGMLVVSACLFALGARASGLHRKVLIRVSGVEALVFGALTYAAAFFTVLLVYHLVASPTPMLSALTAFAVAFGSGVLFVRVFARNATQAS
jgi:hypothetical protein